MKKINPILEINKKSNRRKYFKDNYFNLLYMIPVLSGIFIFTFIPMGVSLYYSFIRFDLLAPVQEATKFTLANYKFALVNNFGNVFHSYYITFRFTIIVGGIGFIGSYIVALILNQKIRGIKTFRILFYLPCLIPGLVSTLLWNGITRETGYFNLILTTLGFDPFTFYTDNKTVFLTQILLSGWGFSGGMIMWLAQFKNIPNDLYEEARLSGAGYFKQLFKITIPLSTAMIFYNLIMSIIGNLQSFSSYATYLQFGRPRDLQFVGLLIYETAYTGEYDISLACAYSWILFLVVGVLTFIVLKTSKQWVYYAEDN